MSALKLSASPRSARGSAVRKQGVMSEHVGVWAASGRSLGLDGSWGSGRELGEGRRQVSVLRIRFPSLLQCVS